jgi:hypothetical protein
MSPLATLLEERAALYAAAATNLGLVRRQLADGSFVVEGTGPALDLNRAAEALKVAARAIDSVSHLRSVLTATQESAS